MSLVKISSRGQITLPSRIRSKLGIRPKDKLEVMLKGKEVVILPVKSFKNFRGSVIAKEGDSRKVMREAVAKHVLETG